MLKLCAFLTILGGAALTASAQPPVLKPIRTADIYVRGLKPTDFPRMTKLAPNVYVYEAFQVMPNIEHVFITNCFVVVTNDGVLVADALETEEDVRALIAAIAKVTPQPIKYVVIGADHIDHTGGDAAFPSSVTFIAHPTSIATLQRRAADPKRPASAPRVVIPTDALVGDKRVMNLGGTEIQILALGRAHTGGDLQVFLPKENILFMSESYFNRLFPSMATGYPSEWAAMLKKAEAMNARITIPGHGFIDSPAVLKEELTNYRMAVEKVVSEGKRLHDSKVPLESAVRVSELGMFQYWTRCAQNLPDDMRRMYMELDGLLK
jgi:glyoxylase-like metal-dependent hydrolase (beta-lactamase superfamily II)